MVESHEHQIEYVDPVGARTNGPVRVTVLLHWTYFVFGNEAGDGLGHVLRQFRTGDRPRRVAEIPGGDLATPGLIARPVNANRDGRPTLSEHRLVACHKTCEATMHSVPQGYPCFVRLVHIEMDGVLKVDFINIATPVTGSVGLVALLWHHRSPSALAKWMVWLR